VDGVRYDRVVLVGHSLGSLIAWYEAPQFHDVDCVISSGDPAHLRRPSVARFGLTLYPAAFDPRLPAGSPIRDTSPRCRYRAQSFYYLPNADQQ